MGTGTTDPVEPQNIEPMRWRIDPSRSSVEFHVPHFYGLMTVKGRFERYEGTVSLAETPAIRLTIDADSLDTKNVKRDKHLRSADFFDIEHHPQARFVSDSATLNGERLTVSGRLHADGNSIPLDLEATLRRDGDELELETTTFADQRQLGMTWSPLGIARTPSKLVVRGRLVPEGAFTAASF